MTSSDRAGALSPVGRSMRLIRSVAAALACVTTAALGHQSAGGHLSGPAVLAVFVGGAAITWKLSSRQVTTGQVVGLLLLCQVSVHLAAADAAMAMDARMLLGHALATVTSALVLARGERFAWSIAERLGLRVLPILYNAAIAPSPRPQVPVLVPRSRRDVLLVHSRWLRGPPTGSW